MATWAPQAQTPDVKFETSPAESFLSAPGEMYPSLFATSPSNTTTTMNPLEMMTPPAYGEEKSRSSSPAAPATGTTATDQADDDDTASSEKKPGRKRKSWGQVLPEPKTNLPPRYDGDANNVRRLIGCPLTCSSRKRAKTEDEKEQRRVERVLRNRRAAQSSRERKRLEVEALEKRNQELEAKLLAAEKTNMMLFEMFNKAQRGNGAVPSLDSLRPNAVATFSTELFGSHGGRGA
ncbi:MAG: hypothetical protein OK454_10210, partial [Thaumarchaeota archaeon]|nr:hypothetical protein [Nitrososphaerota archaeon]